MNDWNPAPHTPPADEPPEPAESSAGVFAPLLGCAAALAMAVVVLRVITGGGDPPRDGPPTPVAAPASEPVPTTVRLVSVPVMRPAPTATPGRTVFANLDEAAERLGFRVWQPTDLPEQYGYLSVSWQPDSHVLVPGHRPGGVLRTWYWRLEHGAGLLLEQGPGVSVSADGAPAGRHGVITLPEGRILVWVRGRLMLPIDPHTTTMVWSGDELRVGLPANGSRPGWRLISSVLTLEDLLRVAEGLR